ncbi:MAG: hypothetical protein CL967_05610 [Euryarchaeota archaeon]|nr:hypothetical protein [Euryarchaeota archaeon]
MQSVELSFATTSFGATATPAAAAAAPTRFSVDGIYGKSTEKKTEGEKKDDERPRDTSYFFSVSVIVGIRHVFHTFCL